MPKQVQFTVEVLKQAMNSFKHVLLLADKNHLDFIAEEWSASVEVDQKTGKAVTGSLKDIYEVSDSSTSNITNYFEKLVLVDFLYGNPITHYFIKFKRFPYQLKGSESLKIMQDTDTLMIVWYFYYDKLQKTVKERLRDAERAAKSANDGLSRTPTI